MPSNSVFREAVTKVAVTGRRTNSTLLEPFDLLQDDITTKKMMVRLNARGRALDPTAAFEAIIEAHEELRVDIENAVSVVAAPTDVH